MIERAVWRGLPQVQVVRPELAKPGEGIPVMDGELALPEGDELQPPEFLERAVDVDGREKPWGSCASCLLCSAKLLA